MDGWTDGWVDGCMDEWVDRWADGWVVRWVSKSGGTSAISREAQETCLPSHPSVSAQEPPRPLHMLSTGVSRIGHCLLHMALYWMQTLGTRENTGFVPGHPAMTSSGTAVHGQAYASVPSTW